MYHATTHAISASATRERSYAFSKSVLLIWRDARLRTTRTFAALNTLAVSAYILLSQQSIILWAFSNTVWHLFCLGAPITAAEEDDDDDDDEVVRLKRFARSPKFQPVKKFSGEMIS